MTASQRIPGETVACCKEEKKTAKSLEAGVWAAGTATSSHSSQPCGVGRVPLSNCRVTSGYKVQAQAWSEPGCPGAASADTLAAAHGARVYVPRFLLNYLSRASVFHYRYGMAQGKRENERALPATPPTGSHPAVCRCPSRLPSPLPAASPSGLQSALDAAGPSSTHGGGQLVPPRAPQQRRSPKQRHCRLKFVSQAPAYVEMSSAYWPEPRGPDSIRNFLGTRTIWQASSEGLI